MSSVQSTLIIGDLSVKAANNTALHGTGRINLDSDVNLANVDAKITATSGDLTIKAASVNPRVSSDLWLNARNGNLNDKGAVHITSGDGGVIVDSYGVVSTTSTGNISEQSTAGTLTAQGYLDTSVISTTGDVTIKANNASKVVKLSNGTNARVTASATTVDIDAPTVLLGKAASNIIIGDSNSATTDTIIYGNLTVQGAMNTVHSTNTEFADQMIILGGSPATNNNLTGLYLQRDYVSAFAGQTAILTTTLASQSSLGSYTLTLVSATGIQVGHAISMTLVDTTVWYNDVVAVSGNTITLYKATKVLMPTSTTIRVYAKNASVIAWDEAAKEFKVGFTNSNITSTQVTLSTLGDLHVNKLVTDQPLESSTLATTTVTLAANNTIAVTIAPLNAKYRGSMYLMVEGPTKGNAGAAWSIVKMNEDTASFVLSGCASDALYLERLEFIWPIGAGPQLRHAITRTGGASAGTGVNQLSENIVYRVKYMTLI
jgi:hypothetical protein